MAGPHPRQIVGQITAGLSQLVDGTVEIRLNPAELGRITIQLVEVAGGGHSASVVAEKPEVLDLLRRNENLLDAEFDNAGIDLTSLNFGQKDDAKDDQSEELATFQKAENDGEVESSGAFNRPDRLANLDIRL
jgi:flagellar hook-length control protein FliK